MPQRLTLSMLFELKQHAYKELKKIQRFYLFSIFAVYQLKFLKDIWYDKTYVINVLWWKKKDNS